MAYRTLTSTRHRGYTLHGRLQFKEWSDGRQLVNAVHQDIPTQFDRTRFVSSDGLNHIGDKTHFDAESARELGRRCAEAYSDISHITSD